jgi:hypothetical protein
MFNVQRWTGAAWNTSMCSPYKTYTEAMNHVKKYSWHYTTDNPYRIVEHKEKKKKYKFDIDCDDEGIVYVNKVMR